jgi:hypothetical protein
MNTLESESVSLEFYELAHNCNELKKIFRNIVDIK